MEFLKLLLAINFIMFMNPFAYSNEKDISTTAIINHFIEIFPEYSNCVNDSIIEIRLRDTREFYYVEFIRPDTQISHNIIDYIGKNHYPFPTNYKIVDGRLFYWFNPHNTISEELIETLYKFRAISAPEIEEYIITGEYYNSILFIICKNNINQYIEMTGADFFQLKKRPEFKECSPAIEKTPRPKSMEDSHSSPIIQAIEEFAAKSKAWNCDSIFEVDLDEDSLNFIVKIYKPNDYIYPTVADTINSHSKTFPTDYLKFGNKLFYWSNHRGAQITENLLDILTKSGIINWNWEKERYGHEKLTDIGAYVKHWADRPGTVYFIRKDNMKLYRTITYKKYLTEEYDRIKRLRKHQFED